MHVSKGKVKRKRANKYILKSFVVFLNYNKPGVFAVWENDKICRQRLFMDLNKKIYDKHNKHNIKAINEQRTKIFKSNK